MSSILLNSAMIICFVAGKSGGHLLPCITQANQIKKEIPHAQVYVFSSGSNLDKTILQKHPQIQHYIPTTLDNPPYQQPWMLPWFALKTAWYFCKSLYKLWQIKPQKIISFGGFVSIPTCLAAKCLGIPFEIHELNVEPGKATQLLSKITDTIYICFDSTRNYFPTKQCIHFDYPIRFTTQDKLLDKPTALATYHFSPHRTTILILGGSQGSVLLNQIFKDMIMNHPEIDNKIQVIHQTGQSDPFDYSTFYALHTIPSHVFGYHERLQDFYQLADVIISRAGAGSLFEIKFFEKPCITIPHETANTNHQIKNVLELQKEFPDQFKIISQSECTPDLLYTHLLPYVSGI